MTLRPDATALVWVIGLRPLAPGVTTADLARGEQLAKEHGW